MSTSTSNNDKYPEFCKLAATDDFVFANFKTNPTYNEILEHVTFEEGAEYYKHTTQKVRDLLPSVTFDSIGGPVKHNYYFGTYSSTTLRYAKILSDLSQIDLNGKEIVEIGCGYGGQYTLIRKLFTPKKYTFIDLAEPLMLLKKYITKAEFNDIDLQFVTPENIQNTQSDLVISNYAFSECDVEIQDIYIKKYINNSNHGYMIYNNQRGYKHFELQTVCTKKIKIFPETPQTHPNNVLITW